VAESVFEKGVTANLIEQIGGKWGEKGSYSQIDEIKSDKMNFNRIFKSHFQWQILLILVHSECLI
jgi:hypothetical protein